MKRMISWILILSFAFPAGAFAGDDKKAPATVKVEKDDPQIAPVIVKTPPITFSSVTSNGNVSTITSNGNMASAELGSRDGRRTSRHSPERVEKQLEVYYSHFIHVDPKANEEQKKEDIETVIGKAKADSVIGGASEASHGDLMIEAMLEANSCLKTDITPADNENEAGSLAENIAMLSPVPYNDLLGHLGAEYMSMPSRRPAIDMLVKRIHDYLIPTFEGQKSMTWQNDLTYGVLAVWGVMIVFKYGPVAVKGTRLANGVKAGISKLNQIEVVPSALSPRSLWVSRGRGLWSLFRYRVAAEAVSELGVAEARRALPEAAAQQVASAASVSGPDIAEAVAAAKAEGMTGTEIAKTTSRARKIAQWLKDKGILGLKKYWYVPAGLAAGAAWHMMRDVPRLDPAIIIENDQIIAVARAEEDSKSALMNLKGFNPEFEGIITARQFISDAPEMLRKIQLLKQQVDYLKSAYRRDERQCAWAQRDLELAVEKIAELRQRIYAMERDPNQNGGTDITLQTAANTAGPVQDQQPATATPAVPTPLIVPQPNPAQPSTPIPAVPTPLIVQPTIPADDGKKTEESDDDGEFGKALFKIPKASAPKGENPKP